MTRGETIEDLEMNAFEPEDAAMPYSPEEDTTTDTSSPIEDLKESHERELMAIDGVEGVGIGRSRIGNDAIIVYLRDEGARNRIPRSISGYPVEILITGVIDAS
jgi:hypothetical protein